MSARILCLDFDGVLHSYSSGWKGGRNIPDPPVPGAIEWLNAIVPDGDAVGGSFDPRHDDFKVCIYSSRSRYWGGRKAMKAWLLKHGFEAHKIENLGFPLMKPPAFLQIDDRAITFTGTFPSVQEMLAFKPWHKK